MKFAILILLCAYLAVSTASINDSSHKKKKATKSSKQQKGNGFFIIHRMTETVVGPHQGEHDPPDNTSLIVHYKPMHDYDRWQFVPIKGFGHFGYIKHAVHSEKFISPASELDDPEDDTNLVILPVKIGSITALFSYNPFDEHWMHFEGKFMTPTGGNPVPEEYCKIDLKAAKFASLASRFFNVDDNGNMTYPYPDPDLSGDWEIIKAFMKPESASTETFEYNIGKSLTKSVTERKGWYVSTRIAKELFGTRARFSEFYKLTVDATWTPVSPHSETITLAPDRNVVVWQYVYRMDQYDEQYTFWSNIIIETDSMVKKPSLKHSVKKPKESRREEL